MDNLKMYFALKESITSTILLLMEKESCTTWDAQNGVNSALNYEQLVGQPSPLFWVSPRHNMIHSRQTPQWPARKRPPKTPRHALRAKAHGE